MTIVQLSAENIKRLKAVRITPDGAMVPITGRNGAGKSSVLDAVAMVLGGKDLVPSMPLRTGQAAGKIEAKLGELTVVRKFARREDGSVSTTLDVLSREGAKYPSPQTVLDKLLGDRSFDDPLAFSRMSPAQQAAALARALGVDIAAHAAARKALYDERTVVNRDAKALDARIAANPEHAAPAEPVDIAALAGVLQAAERAKAANDSLRIKAGDARRAVEGLTNRVASFQRELDAAKREVAKLEVELATAQSALLDGQDDAAQRAEEVQSLRDPDTSAIHARLKDAEAVNDRVRSNASRREAVARVAKLHAEADALTGKIAALDAEHVAAITAAKLPVDGLAFDESGVTLGGIPFAQASSAEQLRVSVALCLAANPKVRVLLIRDGSYLDSASLALVAGMAEAAKAQVWVERVTDGEPVGIRIEDGEVKETPNGEGNG